MFVFLPPSEGKAAPPDTSQSRLDLDALALPQVREQRMQVLEALIEASGRQDAQQVLKVGSTVMAEVEANRSLLTAAAAPAHQIYTGVLFEALDADSLSAVEMQRAADQVLIFSGLFGVTNFTDMIPAHRLSMGVTLSPFGDHRDPGRLASFWRSALETHLSSVVGDQLVIDCRSSTYVPAFRPGAQQTLVVNSFAQKHGQRRVVTHFAKHARGLLAGMLLRQPQLPSCTDEVAEIASAHWEVELREAAGNRPHQLDLIARAE